MNSDPVHFRKRAEECRELAETARDMPTIKFLLMMADELEEEARQIEANEQTAD